MSSAAEPVLAELVGRRLVLDDDRDLVEGGRERHRDRGERPVDELLERAVARGAGRGGPANRGGAWPWRPYPRADGASDGRRPGPGRDRGARGLRRGRRARRPDPLPRLGRAGRRRRATGRGGPRARPRSTVSARRLDLDAGRAAAPRAPARSSRWTCAATACPTPRPRTAPTTSRSSPRTSSPSPRAPGCCRRLDDRVVLAGHGFGAIVAAAAAGALGPRCAGLVLVDGGWESLEASTGLDVDEFLRGLDEPPEVMRSMTAFLADRAAFDPATWDADQERAARATVVETHAGRVVPVTRPHVLEACVRDDVRRTTRSRRSPRSRRRSSRSRPPPRATTRPAPATGRWPRRAPPGSPPAAAPIRVGVVRPRRAQPDALPSRCGQRGDPGGRRRADRGAAES